MLGVNALRGWARITRIHRGLRIMDGVVNMHAALTYQAFRERLEADEGFAEDYARYARTYGATRLPMQTAPGAPPALGEVMEAMWSRHLLTRAWDRWTERGTLGSTATQTAPLDLWPLSHDAEARYCRAVQGRLGRVLATVGAAASEDSVGATFDRLMDGAVEPRGGISDLVQGCVADFLVVMRAQAAPPRARSPLRLMPQPRTLSPRPQMSSGRRSLVVQRFAVDATPPESPRARSPAPRLSVRPAPFAQPLSPRSLALESPRVLSPTSRPPPAFKQRLHRAVTAPVH